VVYLQSLWL